METTIIDRKARVEGSAPKRRRGRVFFASTLLGLALGGGVFLATRPTAAELEAARAAAQQASAEGIVDYYRDQWWKRATPAEKQAFHGQELIEYYTQLWEAMNR